MGHGDSLYSSAFAKRRGYCSLALTGLSLGYWLLSLVGWLLFSNDECGLLRNLRSLPIDMGGRFLRWRKLAPAILPAGLWKGGRP